eukprot:PhM_4_TR2735/c0_g1_i1/m.52620
MLTSTSKMDLNSQIQKLHPDLGFDISKVVSYKTEPVPGGYTCCLTLRFDPKGSFDSIERFSTRGSSYPKKAEAEAGAAQQALDWLRQTYVPYLYHHWMTGSFVV